jgi:hypothetical protein
MDLRNNKIKKLPLYFLSCKKGYLYEIDLRGNPLTTVYRKKVEVGLNVVLEVKVEQEEGFKVDVKEEEEDLKGEVKPKKYKAPIFNKSWALKTKKSQFNYVKFCKNLKLIFYRF